ncbi:MAG TPA: J domain-containing protein [Candidatus Competibacter sp.]|nr:J domain-containing protein [Candidatus Competibacteraceae bacterium]HPE72571.1 J domain-containing protein [Candidatus Competibacter sp.]HRW65256.1 J domain-containing protein [Candidatus Competibacter sp.]
MPNPFTVLGVAETDDDDTIKKAYLQQVREHPPERDADRFQTIRAAYEAIKTSRDRLSYRLFQSENPDLTGLVASALQAGPRRRPSERQLLQVLQNHLTGPK